MLGYLTSLLCAIITFGMALLQVSLTFGSPLGEYALGGQHKILPRKMRYLSTAYALLFIFIGTCYLQKGSIVNIGLNSSIVTGFIIVNTLFLGYAIIGNSFLTKSKKEKYVMTPFSIIQFVLSCITLFFT
jgi:hypothetical protein